MPNPFRRHRRRAPFPGIEVRISTVNGPLVLADSEQLYYAAKYSGAAATADGWFDLVAGSTTDELGQLPPGGQFSVVPLRIEIRAVMLAGR